jgi:3-isopropylmalate dehydratase, small subunit
VLDRPDVDTDQIIPKQFLKRIERTGLRRVPVLRLAQGSGVRAEPAGGAGNEDPAGGRNFGCGSSREHAPWALADYGFEAIVAPSYGDIFRQNSLKIGLLPVRLPVEQVHELMTRAHAGEELTVDLEACTAGDFAFELDDFSRECLLGGLDEIALTLREDDAITAYESTHAAPISTLVL